jgi:tripartite-type tricarboxylate transporter receptor subunit TctC
VLALALVAGTGAQALAEANTYPDRPITLVAPVTAGSSLDIEARELAITLGKELNESIAVLDVPGASGATGIAQVMSAAANGYTLLYESDSTVADLIALKQIPYTLTEIQPVVQFDGEATAFYTATTSPYQTLKQVVTYAKAHPDQLSIASTGTSGTGYDAYTGFEKAAGIKLKYISTEGGSQSSTDVLNGTTTFGLTTPSAYYPEQEAGKIRTIAVAAAGKTYSPLKDTPTFEAAGYPVTSYSLKGIYIKEGTPASVINKIAEASQKAAKSAAWKNYESKNLQLPQYLGPSADKKHVKSVLAAAVKSGD